MRVALRPYAAAGIAVVGAGSVAVAPVVDPDTASRAVEDEVRVVSNTIDLVNPISSIVGALGNISGSPASAVADAVVYGSAAVNAGASNLSDLAASAAAVSGSAASAGAVSSYPLITPGQLVTDTAANLGVFWQDFLEKPFPILQQLVANQVGYARDILGGLGGSTAALVNEAAMLPNVLQTAFTDLTSGDFLSAATALWNYVFQTPSTVGPPLAQGIAAVIGGITIHVSNVILHAGDMNGWWDQITSAPGFPFNAAASAIAAVGQNIVDDFGSGDYPAALNNLVLAPTTILGAFLNGYPGVPGVITDPAGALLTNGTTGVGYGTVTDLMLAREIIAGLIAPTFSVAKGSSAAVDPTLATDFGSVLGNVTAGVALNPAALAADLSTALNVGGLATAVNPTDLAGLIDPTLLADISGALSGLIP